MSGRVAWIDLTVDAAEDVRDFYANVVGWRPEPASMGDYDDYNMLPSDDEAPVAGICHARGENAGIPAQWMIYVTVPDVAAAAEAVEAHGGRVLRAPKQGGKSCIIQDPAGAVMTLYQD